MTAGSDRGYESHMAKVHSEKFGLIREDFARRLREVLLKSGQFDYILIDARTGFSDEAYIACRWLCDHVVVLTGLNDQNIEGTGRFLSKASAWSEMGKPPRSVALIASPVPEHEEELKGRRFVEAKARLAELSGAQPAFALELPYDPRLSLYEELVVEHRPRSGLGRAYQQLAEILRDMADDSFADWARRAAEAINRHDTTAALAALHRAAAIDQGQAALLAALARQVASRGLDLGHYEEARAPYEESLALYREVGDRWGISLVLRNLAALDGLQGRYGDARRGLEESLAIERELGGRREACDALYKLAELDRLQGRYEQARRGLEESLAIGRELAERQSEGVALWSLAELDRLQGHYEDARQGFEESRGIFAGLDLSGETTYITLHLETAAAQGRPDLPLQPLREVAARARQCPNPLTVVKSHSLLGQVLRQRGEVNEARGELAQGVESADAHGLRGLAAEMRADLALVLAQADQPAGAAAAARAALGFFQEQDVVHPHLDRLRELAGRAKEAPR